MSRVFELLQKTNRAGDLFDPEPAGTQMTVATPSVVIEGSTVSENSEAGLEPLGKPNPLAQVTLSSRTSCSDRTPWNQLMEDLLQLSKSTTGCSVGICAVKRGESATGFAAEMASRLRTGITSPAAIVEATFHKPCLGRVFGVPKSPGLSEMLLGSPEWLPGCIHESGFRNLSVVPAGSAIRHGHWGGLEQRFHLVYQMLSSRFRDLIFVLPAANDTRDFPFPYSLLGGVVLAVTPYCTAVRDVRKAVLRLSRRDARVISAVLTRRGKCVPW